MKTYYELLTLSPLASPDEIKKAFRREIARYHPDKVQHLGKEFQEMAAGIAADLTEAYRILMDPALRAKYDEGLRGPTEQPEPASSSSAAATARPQPRRPDGPPAEPAPEPRPAAVHRAASSAGTEFVRKATISKVRAAVSAVLEANSTPAAGFDAAFVVKAKKGLFKKGEPGIRLLVKVVSQVDGAAVADAWPLALKAIVPETIPTLLLMGSSLAPAKELATAVTEQRRRARGAGPVLVPVDVRDWEALFPPDTPVAVRSVIQRLRAGEP